MVRGAAVQTCSVTMKILNRCAHVGYFLSLYDGDDAHAFCVFFARQLKKINLKIRKN